MLPWVPLLLAVRSFGVDGIVVAVDPAARSMLVAHRPIGKYMPAMTMPFRVVDVHELDGLYPGEHVQFELAVGKEGSIARRVHKADGGDVEIEAPKGRLHIGDALPEFSLTDQQGKTVRLQDLRGSVVAINFIYTRCPLPDVCPRLSANFATLQRRFHDRLLLLSITVDPEFDTSAVLAEYARRWGADPSMWRFLTGDVGRLSAALGEVAWTDEGSIGHNSMTSIVNREGRLAARIDGSGWRVDQMEHLIAHALEEK